MSFTTGLLWQNDPRWADAPLGNGPQTIKQWGCLATSLTMVVNGCGYNETPQTLCQKMVGIGAFNGAFINAYRLGEAFPGVSLAHSQDYATPPAPLAAIDVELANNRPVLVRVDQSPAPDIQDHWVVLYAKDGNDYLMWDPYCYTGDAPGMRIHLTDRYKNSGPTAAQAIVSAIFFNISGKTSAGTATPTPAQVPAPATNTSAPTNAIQLTPTGDLLALRATPDAGGTLVERFSLGTVLLSLESASATQAKIGQYNQWIRVQAPDGSQGYVAAWFVGAVSTPTPSPVPATPVTPTSVPVPASTAATPTSAPTPASSSAPTLPATGFTVKATVDGTDFRKLPVVNASTLIARVPVGATFTTLDPNASKLIKDFNAWLKVKDASGRVGYIAARKVSI